MKKLVSLLALFMLAASMASAASYLVSDPTVGAVNTAVAACVPGDEVVLAAGVGVFQSGATITLNGVTLRGQNPTVTLNCTVGFCINMSNGAAVKNMHLTFNSGWGPGLRMTAGSFLLSHLLIDVKTGTDTPTIHLDPSKAPALPLTGLIEYVTTKNIVTNNGIIQPGGGWSGGNGSNCGPIVVNHCDLTMASGSGYVMMVQTDWTTDCSMITVKNSIVGAVTKAGPQVAGLFFSNVPYPGTTAQPNYPQGDQIKLNLHHNLIVDGWMYMAYDWGSAIADNPDTTDVDESRPSGYLDSGVAPGPANSSIGGCFVVTNPFDVTFPITDDQMAALDMKLQPNTSPALWKADDGLNIGSDVVTVPVELSAFEIE